ncbi:MAG: hypothetical protein M3069_04180 [Chloroflexota bacterium]|nr:hypothetical protein [Chloroflexota bacterium]
MSQINVNAPEPVVESRGDRSAAAGINLITVLIVLAVLAVIAWFLFSGPLRSMTGGATNINVNPPSQPNAPAPAGNSGTGSNTAPANQAPANNNQAPAPAKP